MLIHTVLFSLRTDAAGAAAELLEACRTESASIPGAGELVAGIAAPTTGSAVDGDYSVGLCIRFADRAGHDAYQSHPVHVAFVERFRPTWERVRVFDFEEGGVGRSG